MGLDAISGGQRHPSQLKKKEYNTDRVAHMLRSARGRLDFHVVHNFLLQVGDFIHTPSAVIPWRGQVGLSLVAHGKVVAYKSTLNMPGL